MLSIKSYVNDRVAILFAALISMTAGTAIGQTFGYVQNRSGSTFAFSYNGQPIRMADPTCLPLTIGGETWFFVTGSSDDHNTGNFPIFKSKDLQHWCFHGVAFDYGTPSLNVAFPASPPGFVVVGGRRFESLWSPQLWVNPNGLDTQVHLTFTAAEKTTTGTTRIELSVMVSNIALSQFQTGGSYFGAPLWYSYTSNGGATTVADGGVSRGSNWVIPSTIGPFYEGTVPGTARHLLSGWEHIGRENQRTNPADGSFVFFDPRAVAGQKAWLLYNTFQVKQGTGATPYGLATTDYDGANCAAFPLWSTYLLNAHDASPVQKPVELFHRFNDTNRPPPTTCTTIPPQSQWVGGSYGWYGVPNGSVTGEPTSTCLPHWMLTQIYGGQYYFPSWAEGPCALYWNNNYYVFASRNMWWGPAYMMTYRVIPATGSTLFKDTGLSAPNDRSVTESVLVAGNWLANSSGGRDSANTRSFGDGEPFLAFGQPYLVFHAKLEGSNERRIFFKELTLDTDLAHWRRLYDGHPSTAQDLNWFWTRTDVSQCP